MIILNTENNILKMEIKLKDNVVFIGYNDEVKMKEKIMDFIMDAKTSKILYKGNPININYKLLKKILPLDQIKFDSSINSINKFVEIENKDIREVYSELLESVDCKYCLIHKL